MKFGLDWGDTTTPIRYLNCLLIYFSAYLPERLEEEIGRANPLLEILCDSDILT
jgi:hypothetical protein